MSLGLKLQKVHKKVNIKLGVQDGAIIFRKRTVTEAANFGKPYTSAPATDVTITAGIKVERVKSYETDGGGTIQVGDLKLTIPANLITETQLTDAEVIYNNQSYSIITRFPTEIYSGVAVQWRVIARLKVA